MNRPLHVTGWAKPRYAQKRHHFDAAHTGNGVSRSDCGKYWDTPPYLSEELGALFEDCAQCLRIVNKAAGR